MKKLIVIVMSLIATSTIAMAQAADPYAASEAIARMKAQVLRTQQFLGNVENISNARHCGVFKNYDFRIGFNIMRRFALEIFGAD
jgi:hypothetical protein